MESYVLHDAIQYQHFSFDVNNLMNHSVYEELSLDPIWKVLNQCFVK